MLLCFFYSSTVTLPPTTQCPTMSTLCSSLRSRPAAPWPRRPLSYPLCPPFLDLIALFWRWSTQTAPAASCLRCDQSGARIKCGARALYSLSFFSLFLLCLLLLYLLLVFHWGCGSTSFREVCWGRGAGALAFLPLSKDNFCCFCYCLLHLPTLPLLLCHVCGC